MADMSEDRNKLLGKLMLEEFYPDDLIIAHGLNFKYEILEIGSNRFVTLEIADDRLKPYFPAMVFSIQDFHKFAQATDQVDRDAGGYFEEGISEIEPESPDDLTTD